MCQVVLSVIPSSHVTLHEVRCVYTSDQIHKVFFTGFTAIGLLLLSLSADAVKKCTWGTIL